MNQLRISYQTNLLSPELQLVFINGQEAGEIENKGDYYQVTAVCGKMTTKPTHREALDFITQFLSDQHGKPINQTKLF